MNRDNDSLLIDVDELPPALDPKFLEPERPAELPKKADGTPDIDLKDDTSDDERRQKKDENNLIEALKRDRVEMERQIATEKKARADAEAAANLALEEERGLRTKAEDAASVRTDQAMRAHWRSINADLHNLTSAISATQIESSSAEREYALAMQEQDYARAGAAQKALAKAEALLVRLEDGKSGVEREIEETRRAFESSYKQRAAGGEVDRPVRPPAPAPKTEERPAQAPQVTPEQWIESDQVRNVVGRDGVEWLKEHKEFATDERLHRKLLRFVDDFADDHGQGALKSSGFIEALNDKFFPNREDDDVAEEVEVGAPAAQAVRKSAPAAPVSRSAPARSSSGNSGGKVRLSALEQQTALQMYPDDTREAALKRYATNKTKAMADGHYNK